MCTKRSQTLPENEHELGGFKSHKKSTDNFAWHVTIHLYQKKKKLSEKWARSKNVKRQQKGKNTHQ